MSIKKLYEEMDQNRYSKLRRARKCAALTIPELLPPESTTGQDSLPVPFQSIGSTGVTNLAAKMLSAMLPVGQTPFFRFSPRDGSIPEQDVNNYLERLSYQVYRRLTSNNLRDQLYIALQHLIVTGDVGFVFHDDFTFSVIRLDHFVVDRAADGSIKKFIFLEFEKDDSDAVTETISLSMPTPYTADGYTTTFCEYSWNDSTQEWDVRKEREDEIIETGSYKVAPISIIRWSGVAGEDYGRAKCEEMIGDLMSLDSYSEAMIETLAAASRFYIGINPTGMADIDDLEDTPNGGFVGAKADDIFTFSPAQSMNPSIQATSQAVSTMRGEVSKQFLMGAGAVRDAERVTAAEVRMLATELENVLGGAFSSISRELLAPLVKRAFFLMVTEDEIDERLAEEFISDDGHLSMEVVTGLQAMSRDSDLSKLMQMGQTIQQLPPQAQERFRWNEYANALVTALGFDSRQWVVSDEEIQAQKMQEAQMQQMAAAQQSALRVGEQAAAQDLEQTGGANIESGVQAAQQAGLLPPGQ